jgi:hypothetical protein
LGAAVAAAQTSPDAIRDAIGDRPYLMAGGTSVLEDYRQILARIESFNSIVALISRAGQETLKQSTEYRDLEGMLAAEKARVSAIKDRNARTIQKATVDATEAKLKALVKTPPPGIDPWLVDGIKLWINTYGPSRLHLRIYPFLNCPSFHVLCNLKRDCFVDADLEHLLYGFGHRPNVPLEVFGVITSMPTKEEPSFDPLREFEETESLGEREEFEKAFRGVFRGMDGMEAFMRFSRYPIVTVHPIAVYRSFRMRPT